ncbi:MAG TPA: hypothetical protein VK966_01360, partial [Longimicrobiales bacterium]|nr:hypothetical protein [Longimicrobiales bacterium]
ERGIRLLGFRNLGAVTPALLPYATALSELPATREQGLRMLRFTTTYSAVETAEAFLALARALEQAERREEARQAYAHVVRLWDGADGYRQDEVREARDALVRLTGEGSARPVQ